MQLFQTDSLQKQLDNLKQYISQPLSFFAFGDSLRKIDNISSIKYMDQNSHMPKTLSTSLENIDNILIISDGNWYDKISKNHSLYKKQSFFISLKQIHHKSHLKISASIKQKEKKSNKSDSLITSLTGFKTDNKPIILTIKNKNRIITKHIVHADSGFFTKTPTLLLPIRKEGVHLLELTALYNDTVRNSHYLRYQKVKNTYSVYIYAKNPSLDKRFLTLAFDKHPEFTLQKTLIKRPDFLYILDWDLTAQKLFKKYPDATITFIGCLPGRQSGIKPTTSFKPVLSQSIRYELGYEYESLMPPPLFSYTNLKPSYSIQRNFISLDTSSISDKKGKDIPIYFEALFNNRLVLILASKGYWRWNFWPLSLSGKSLAKSFSNVLIKQCKELFTYNTNQSFYVYPGRSPVYEHDSIYFYLSLPAYVYNKTEVIINLSISDIADKIHFDSTYAITPYRTLTNTLSCPPIKKGIYYYTATAINNSRKSVYTDTINICKNNSEFSTYDQNKMILGEFATSISLFDTDACKTFSNIISQNSNNKNAIIKTYVHLKRSWLLLIIIFVFFTSEWILRRIWKLD